MWSLKDAPFHYMYLLGVSVLSSLEGGFKGRGMQTCFLSYCELETAVLVLTSLYLRGPQQNGLE